MTRRNPPLSLTQHSPPATPPPPPSPPPARPLGDAAFLGGVLGSQAARHTVGHSHHCCDSSFTTAALSETTVPRPALDHREAYALHVVYLAWRVEPLSKPRQERCSYMTYLPSLSTLNVMPVLEITGEAEISRTVCPTGWTSAVLTPSYQANMPFPAYCENTDW